MTLNRRSFMQLAGGAAAATQLFPLWAQSAPRRFAANDTIQFALVGAGGRGQSDTRVALGVPGVKLVAVADCYNGRLVHSKELWGNDIMTTRDYREILARKDVDAILLATPDHWHKQVAIDAMKAGKDVYCEKPMIHMYSDGPAMIETAHSTERILQVGSQRVSSILYIKAKELIAAGAIGKLNMVQAHWDRNSAQGAWDYTVPLDASTETCDWPRFLGTAPKIPFSAERFFQWRKWSDYGTGVAGDLFVHLFSGTHFITGSMGPTRSEATGGIRYWKDGRDAPDVLLGLFDYPEGFNLSLRVNFVNGGEESEGFVFTGDEGTLEITTTQVIVNRVPHEKGPGYSVGTFTNDMQKRLQQAYTDKYPATVGTQMNGNTMEKFTAPRNYNDTYDHFYNWFDCIRTRRQPVEDATFGFRAAGAALLSNRSIERGAAIGWDPKGMKLV